MMYIVGVFGSNPHPPAQSAPSIRDTLFGDMPMDAFPCASNESPKHEPWRSFVLAREAFAKGRKAEAVEHWLRITELPDQESRIYLQAWYFLRAQGIQSPVELAKQLLGIVVEVAMPGGLDLLAAYADHRARYYNYSGAGVVWEHANDSLDPSIDALLSAGAVVLRQIGPWTEARPAPPTGDQVRINFLSPAGLHFGQGSMRSFPGDPLAKPTFDAATALMQQLVALRK